jgi:hypothetical protein
MFKAMKGTSVVPKRKGIVLAGGSGLARSAPNHAGCLQDAANHTVDLDRELADTPALVHRPPRMVASPDFTLIETKHATRISSDYRANGVRAIRWVVIGILAILFLYSLHLAINRIFQSTKPSPSTWPKSLAPVQTDRYFFHPALFLLGPLARIAESAISAKDALLTSRLLFLGVFWLRHFADGEVHEDITSQQRRAA